MPSIASRLMTDLNGLEPVSQPATASSAPSLMSGDPAVLTVTNTATNLNSIGGSNIVPMRGINPIEQMSDCDLYKFFPYNPYFDRRWSSVYYQLYNGS